MRLSVVGLFGEMLETVSSNEASQKTSPNDTNINPIGAASIATWYLTFIKGGSKELRARCGICES